MNPSRAKQPNLDKHTFKKSLLSAAICTYALASPQVHAEDSQSFALEEIVVTAQKRVQSLQDVPISVSAVGGEKLDDAGIENMQDLSSYVPNLHVVDGTLTPQLFIRGIGSGSNQGFEQSVGTYSDGVYAGRSLQSRAAFMDLERVEVLRGPQSILFGQSSIAGAISLISAKPTDEFEGMVGLSYTPEFGGTEANAVLSGPLTDTLSARLAIRDRQEDGYMDNITLDEEVPSQDEQVARLSLAWEAGDLSADFKTEITRLDRKARPITVIDFGVYPTLAAIGTHGALTQTTAEVGYDTWIDADNELEFDSDNFVLSLEYGLGDHTLTSITAYNEYEYRDENYDGDGTEVDMLLINMAEDFEQFSQELRLTSPGGETIDYIVGVFYQTSEQEYQEDPTLRVSALGLDVLSSLPVGLMDVSINRDFAQEAETYAAFGQMTWNISEELRLNVGLRYTHDEKDGERVQVTYSEAFPGTLAADVPIGGGAFLSDAAASEFNLADHNLKDDYSEENWTPSFSLQYDITPDVMLYANYSEGYKAAGFDARGINGWTSTNAFSGKSGTQLGGDSFFFDQEEAETIELGAKMWLLDGAAELNIAMYHSEYTDMQVSVYDGTFGYAVQNAGEARVRGLELDGRWRATESITLSGSLSYLDFEWTEYTAAACNGAGNLPASPTSPGNCDYTGKENVSTPEWTFNLSANHVAYVGEGMELRSTLDANFKDNHYTSQNLDPRTEMPGMTLINGRIALAASDDKWQIALTGKNLTDREYYNYSGALTQSQTGLFVTMARPRSFAIEGQYRF
ncbi:TonB-dependent receptor [Maricurvus nonylphenolicus]|uniref:TonB-dependent receptor n=1 Tax=Maricurvus nonylphenolicus TaxID=1008307 RepID=UPI0036F1FD49